MFLEHIENQTARCTVSGIGTWCQETSASSNWTAETRLPTNVFHRESDWFNQVSAMVKSVQQHSRFEAWSAADMKWIKQARNNAVDNSNGGTFNVLSRTTFDLAVRREMLIELLLLTIRRYGPAAKAAVDASENP